MLPATLKPLAEWWWLSKNVCKVNVSAIRSELRAYGIENRFKIHFQQIFAKNPKLLILIHKQILFWSLYHAAGSEKGFEIQSDENIEVPGYKSVYIFIAADTKLVLSYLESLCLTNEPRNDKTNKVTVRPAKTQISLDIRPAWTQSSLSLNR